MLTTGNSQYLHPDYLQPLPTTLDAKKSPLALLAQTCSSIGKDPSPTKSMIPSISKKDPEKNQEKHSESPDSNKRPESNSSKGTGRDSSEKPGFRTVSSKDIPPLVPITTSTSSSSTEKTKSPPSTRESKSNENFPTTAVVSSRPGSRSTSVTSSITTSSTSSTRANSCHSRESDGSKDSATVSKHSTRSSPDHVSYISKPVSHPSLSSYAGLQSYPPQYQGFPLMPHGLPLDPSPLSAAQGFAANAAAMAAAQSSALKHASAASAMSPYVTYARVRTPSGATTLVPVCRDPYCSNCQLTLQTSHLSSTCNAPGCAQCAHEKSLQSLSAYGLPSAASLHQFLPGSAAGLLSSVSPSELPGFPSLSSLYPPSALNAHQGLPFVCNWVSSGNDYCGKRFTTSEELLQHLRTHTTASDSSALAAAYGGLNGLAGLHGPVPNPGSLSPNSVRRTYPTSLSPVNGMLGSSRYHPYKSPLTSAPSVLPPPGQPLPSLTSYYYSPYSLYGQRLGAAAVP